MKSIGKRNLHMAVSRTIGSLVAGAFCMVSGLAGAQGYPSKLIKIVVPWAAGGVTDVAARAMARGLSDRMSVPVVVENKSGAAGTIGARFVASAPADGYTLLLASSETQTIAPNLRAKLSYAPQKDFVPIMPFAMATSRFIRLNNWDRTTINLPFGRGALVGVEEINVPSDADAATMERLRLRLEAYLNEATRRAYAKVGRPAAGRG